MYLMIYLRSLCIICDLRSHTLKSTGNISMFAFKAKEGARILLHVCARPFLQKRGYKHFLSRKATKKKLHLITIQKKKVQKKTRDYFSKANY